MSANSEAFEAMRVTTPTARLSHPHLFKPTAIEKGSDDLRYSCELLFDKKTTDVSVLQKPIKVAIQEKWGKNKADWPEPIILPIKDGDKPRLNKRTKKREVKEEHKGMWVVRASMKAEFGKPQVVGRDPKVPIEDPSEIYPGCYVRAALKAFAYEFADKNGVSFNLDAVQFVKDGKPLSGRKKADELFGVVETEDGGDEDLNFDSGDSESFDSEESFA